MNLIIQYRLKTNRNYIRFLRENSHWYKFLNRSDSYFKDFDNEMKIVYQLRPTDKISKAIDTFDMIQTVLSSMK